MIKYAFIPLISTITLLAVVTQKPDLGSPEKAVRSFLTAINAGDLRGAAGLVQGTSAKAVTAAFEHEWRDLTGGVKFTLSDFRAQIGGTSASASFELTYQNPGTGKTTTVPDRVHMRRTKNEWRIVPGAADSLSSGSMLTVSFTAMALADPEAWPRARGAAEALRCMANMRKLCEAALAMRRANEGRFPARASDFRSNVSKHLKPGDVPRCPVDRSSGESYLMNANLQGKRFHEIPLPEETVMLYEGKAQRILFRHDRRAVIGVADGTVRLVNEQQSRTVKWIP